MAGIEFMSMASKLSRLLGRPVDVRNHVRTDRKKNVVILE